MTGEIQLTACPKCDAFIRAEDYDTHVPLCKGGEPVAFWCHDCFERVPVDYEHVAMVTAHIGHRCEYVGAADIESNPKGRTMFLFRPSSVLSAVASLCEQGTLLIEDIAHQLDRRGL